MCYLRLSRSNNHNNFAETFPWQNVCYLIKHLFVRWTNLSEVDGGLRLTEKWTTHHPFLIIATSLHRAVCSLRMDNNMKLFRRALSMLARPSNIALNSEMLHSYWACVARPREFILLFCILLQGFLRRMGEEIEIETQETVDTLPVPKPEETVKREGKHSI